MGAHGDCLDWQVGIPLLSRSMIGTLAGITLGAAAIGVLLVGLLLGVQGDWDAIAPMAMMFGVVAFGLFLLSLGVMALLLRGRIETRFVIDPDGIRLFNVDRLARAATRGAILLGAATGSAVTAGSGLLAGAQEQQRLRWNGAFHAAIDRTRHDIILRNGWRALMRVHCRPENFEAAVELVTRYMARNGTAERRRPRRSIGRYLLRTALACVAALPALMAGELYGYMLLLPFLSLCFALATIWLVRPMAWGVLAGLLATAVLALADALDQRAAYFGSGTFRHYEIFDTDDWGMTALAVAGLGYMAWIAVATLRGRLVPVLEADWRDGGEL